MKKKIILFLSIFVVTVVLTLTIVNRVAINKSAKDEFIVDVHDNEQIKLTKRLLSGTSQTTSASVFQVNATINSSYAVDKTLDWVLEWTDSSIVNEVISDYIETISANDTLTCNVFYKKPFDYQIKLTASLVSNPSIQANCYIDCYQRISTVNLDEFIMVDNEKSTVATCDVSHANRTIDMTNLINDNIGIGYGSIYFDYDSLNTFLPIFNGSISIYYDIAPKLCLSDELKSILADNDWIYYDYEFDLKDNLHELYSMSIFDILNYCLDIQYIEECQEYLLATDNWFTIKLYYRSYLDSSKTNLFEEEIYTYQLINFDYLHYAQVKSISLNNTQLLF